METDQNEKEEIENLKQKIIEEIEFNPTDGINTFESILLSDEKDILTFNEYLDRLQKTLKKCTCQASWMKPTLTVHCGDCQKSRNCCICVHCFLKGNHQGHKVFLTHSSNGTCDCGDPILWSKSGFCCDHPGPEPNPELTQLDKETRIKLIAISKAAFFYYLDYASFNKQSFMNITDWLLKIVSLGDATRRCVCIALRESFEFVDLYVHCLGFEKNEMTKLLKLLGTLTNDEVFRSYFSLSFLRDFPRFIWINNQIALDNKDTSIPPLSAANQLFGFTFHATTTFTVQKLIRESQLDWSQVCNESIRLMLSYNFSQMSKEYNENSRRYSAFNKMLSVFKSALKVFDNTNPSIIKFVEDLAETLIIKEFSFPLTRVFGDKLNDPKKVQSAMFSIYFDLFQLVSKINSNEIYTTKPLEILKDFFDSPIYQSIDKETNHTGNKNNAGNLLTQIRLIRPSSKGETDDQNINKKETSMKSNVNNGDKVYCHSVLDRNVQFAQSFPTHILAFVCLNLKDKKSLYDYISEVTDDVEGFIKKWALIPLRWCAVSDLSDFQLFIRNSSSAITAMHSFKFKKNIKYKYVPIFALLQNLLKLTNDIDDFYLMIISTYGFFSQNDDDLDDNQKRLLLFTIFHFISCLIFDTLCSENNFFTMRRLAVISRLMVSNLSMEEINSVWYNKVLNDDTFCEDLQSFASRITTKNGTQFHLTDSSEWHPLLHYLSISSIISLIQDFINKNPDSLINFPKLPQGSERFLFSPILWALEYHILSHNASKDYPIIHQLIFNVLIITSNNSERYYADNFVGNSDPSDTFLVANDFTNLASQLKNLTFTQFLRMKIIYLHGHKSASFVQLDQEGLSMIDQIKSFGNIGVTVLQRMNFGEIVAMTSSEDSLLKQEEMQKKNRVRANKLKQQIMSSFSAKQKSFKSTISQIEEDTEKVQNFECSVCHLESTDDCFVLPALIFKSPLSSYIKWRFRKATLIDSSENDSNRSDGNINDLSEVPESFELFTAVKICLHPIHSKCIQKSHFTCPTDRCPRNASLPIIGGTFDYKEITDQTVLKALKKFVTQAYLDDVKYAVFSLASELEVLEMRHRSNPGCLDNITTQSTLRNVYLCIWHMMHTKAEKTLAEEEFVRRRLIVSKAIKNEILGTSFDDEFGLTWSQLKDQNGLYKKLPDIEDNLTISENVNNIMSVLIPLKKADKNDSDVKSIEKKMSPHNQNNRIQRNMNDAIRIIINRLNEEEEQNETEDDGDADEDEIDVESESDDVDELLDLGFEMYFNEKGKLDRRKRIFLSPLMKYILLAMARDEEQEGDRSIDMKRFISGSLLPQTVVQSDIEFRKDAEEGENSGERPENDILFNDFDTIRDLSTDYKMLQFMRCAAIFDHFSRNLKITENLTDRSNTTTNENQQPNTNSNSNENQQPNTNSNSNENQQPNINSNSNENQQPNINSNSNENQQPNTNSNSNENQQPNTNSNLNENQQPNTNSNLNENQQPNINLNLKQQENLNLNLDLNQGPNIDSNRFSLGLSLARRDGKNDEFIDWDVILSPSRLRRHYGIEDDDDATGGEHHCEMTLPMFSFIEVPKNYLDFIHPPFSAPILTTDEGNLAICLLTGKIVTMPSNAPALSNDKVKLAHFLKRTFKGSYSAIMHLNGNTASQVIVTDLEFNLILQLQPFYVDKFGDKDIGIRRGSLLYLSDSKREEIIDNFLSGAWTNLVKWPDLRIP